MIGFVPGQSQRGRVPGTSEWTDLVAWDAGAPGIGSCVMVSVCPCVQQIHGV